MIRCTWISLGGVLKLIHSKGTETDFLFLFTPF